MRVTFGVTRRTPCQLALTRAGTAHEGKGLTRCVLLGGDSVQLRRGCSSLRPVDTVSRLLQRQPPGHRGSRRGSVFNRVCPDGSSSSSAAEHADQTMASVRMVGKVTARLFGSVPPLHRALYTARPLTVLHQVQKRSSLLGNCPAFFYSTLAPSSDVSLSYKYGRLVLEVPLPSRKEKCLFYLRPMLMSVGDLIADLHREDPGTTTSVFSKDGEPISNTTLIDALLDKDFQLVINDAVYNICAPEKACTSEHAMEMEDMKHVVHLLHTALHLPEHHLLKERELLERLDNLKQELSPLEQMKAQLSYTADFKSSRVVWTGMALLSVQGGALAWLTWWVYSWDVMEPVTYFITYATSIGAFSYYVLTKQDYIYPDVKDRQFLRYFYKAASRNKFNVEKYNELKDEMAEVEEDLRRLRYPTEFQFPLEQIQPKP